MPGRAEELYKMHLIIAPRWMREINGFPFSETTASAFFSSSKPQFVAAARYSPAYHCAAFPFTLSRVKGPFTPSWTHPPVVPVIRATPESVITSRQWKAICRFTARWTRRSIPLLQFPTFHEWKAFRSRACSPRRNIVPLYFLHSPCYSKTTLVCTGEANIYRNYTVKLHGIK